MNNLFWNNYEFKSDDICPNFDFGTKFTYIPYLKSILYFGGNFKKSDQKILLSKTIEKNIWLYNIDNKSWEFKETKGRHPIKRIYYESLCEKNLLFLIGGKNVKNKIINDLFILNLDTFEWKRFFQLDGPRARVFHGLGFYDEELYLFGGIMIPDKTICTDIWKANLDNIPWESNVLELPGINWMDLTTKEFKFLNVSFFGYIFFNEYIYIFGGFKNNNEPINRVFYYNLSNNEIEELYPKGDSFKPRGASNIRLVNDNMIAICGGFENIDDKLNEDYSKQFIDIYLYYLKENYFLKPNIGGQFPKTINLFESNQENMIICGNIDDKTKYIYILKESVDSYKIIENEPVEISEDSDDYITNKPKKVKKQNKTEEGENEFRKYEEDLINIRNEYNLMEMNHKNEILKNKNSKIKINELKIEMEEIVKEYNEKYNENENLIKEKNTKINENKKILSKLKDLYILKKKIRKLKELKIKKLQNMIYENEKFLIQLDDFITKCVQNELINNYLSRKEYNGLIKYKLEHKQNLINLKESVAEYLIKKQKIITSIKNNKINLKDHDWNKNSKKMLINEKKYLNF